jgi:hypothetical protein
MRGEEKSSFEFRVSSFGFRVKVKKNCNAIFFYLVASATTRNPKLENRNPQPQPATRNPKLETRNPKLYFRLHKFLPIQQ